MRNNWLKWVRGSICISVSGDYLERFFNMCRAHGIDIWNIDKNIHEDKKSSKKIIISKKTIISKKAIISKADKCSDSSEKNNPQEVKQICRCEIYAADLPRCHALLRKTGTRLRVIRKYGLPFYIPFMKKRIIFFAGIFICLSMLNMVTDYVWAIEVRGNYQISLDMMKDFLEEENIRYGIRKDSIDCEEKEKLLRKRFENVTWTSIYFEGTKLLVDIKENHNRQEPLGEVKGTDIIANESGTITSIVTRSGIPQVKAGDRVEKGQLLVSGLVPVLDEAGNVTKYQIYDADADIQIRTPVSCKLDTKEIYPVTEYKDNDKNVIFLEILGYRFDALAFFDRISGAVSKYLGFLNIFNDGRNNRYETCTQKNQMVLLDNIYLPVFYGTICRKEYNICYVKYTEDEMRDKLSDNLEKLILCLLDKGVQIVEKNVKIERNESGMSLSADLLVVKPTGESIPSKVPDTEITGNNQE